MRNPKKEDPKKKLDKILGELFEAHANGEELDNDKMASALNAVNRVNIDNTVEKYTDAIVEMQESGELNDLIAVALCDEYARPMFTTIPTDPSAIAGICEGFGAAVASKVGAFMRLKIDPSAVDDKKFVETLAKFVTAAVSDFYEAFIHNCARQLDSKAAQQKLATAIHEEVKRSGRLAEVFPDDGAKCTYGFDDDAHEGESFEQLFPTDDKKDSPSSNIADRWKEVLGDD